MGMGQESRAEERRGKLRCRSGLQVAHRPNSEAVVVVVNVHRDFEFLVCQDFSNGAAPYANVFMYILVFNTCLFVFC